MSAETFTRWRCDDCSAVHEGVTLPADWDHHEDCTHCPDCQLDEAGQIRRLLGQVAAAELAAHDWQARWRSMRDDRNRLASEISRLTRERRHEHVVRDAA